MGESVAAPTTTTKNKGGRPANPKPQWDADRKVWTVRVTMPKPPGWPEGKEAPRQIVDLPRIPREREDVAKIVAKDTSDRLRRGEGADPSEGETVAQWGERWLKDREARGISSVKDDIGRMRNHVFPVIGPFPIATITRVQVERVVEDLDRKIALDDGDDDAMSWKTAFNVWGLVTKAFDDAVNSKKRDLRARQDNPVVGVKGPERGDRKAKQYLYPDELLRLLAADPEKVPPRYKVLYAVATYTFMRAGELEALEPGDVDLAHGVIQITKSVDRKTGKVKSTKTGETRRLPIEPNLRPLLEYLVGDGKGAKLLWLPVDEDRAAALRRHLLAAGVTRADLHANDAHRKNLTFHDLRATGITWMAVRGDDPLRIKQRAGHSTFQTTEGYIREAENLGADFGEPFPALPEPGEGFGSVSAFRLPDPPKTPGKLRPQRELNPRNARRETSQDSSESSQKQAIPSPRDVSSPTTFRLPGQPGNPIPDPLDADLEAAIVRAALDGRREDADLFTSILRARLRDRAGVVLLNPRRAGT